MHVESYGIDFDG